MRDGMESAGAVSLASGGSIWKVSTTNLHRARNGIDGMVVRYIHLQCNWHSVALPRLGSLLYIEVGDFASSEPWLSHNP